MRRPRRCGPRRAACDAKRCAAVNKCLTRKRRHPLPPLRRRYAPGLPGVRARCFALTRLLAGALPELAAHLGTLCGGADDDGGALVAAVAFVPWLQTLFA